jgi:hypothetical protein
MMMDVAIAMTMMSMTWLEGMLFIASTSSEIFIVRTSR